jgi:hypothetical protein
MTVEVTTSTATRFGNGTTQVFDFPFRVQTAASVKVYSVVNGVKIPLTLGTYTTAINPNGVGGLVTITPAPLVGVRLLIARETDVTQEVSVSAQTRYDPAVAEFVWDKLTMLMQELLLVAAPSEIDLIGEFLGPWSTAHAYVVGDRIFEPVSGNGYQCILAHISGVFNTDLSAGRWGIYVQRGASGAGTGDMLSAQNLNDLASKTAALVNLGGTTIGTGVFKAVDKTAARIALGIADAQVGQDRIINSDFFIWQRALSGTDNGYIAADRWANFFVGGTVTQSRQNHPAGTIFGASCPAFFLRQGVTGQSLLTHFAATVQRIEDVRTYAGQTITVLGWAKRNSGTGNVAIEVVQNFGSGGSPSAEVTGIGSSQITLTGAWTPFAVTINVPSIAGKILGTTGNSFLGLQFWTSAGSTFSARTASLGLQTIEVDLFGIHIRPGLWTAADAALYVPREQEAELARCQRYFEIGTFLIQIPAVGTAAVGGQFVESKRGVPAIATNFGANFGFNTGSITPQAISPHSIGFNGVSTAVGGFCFINWAADSEL